MKTEIFALYLKDLQNINLLTREEEVKLSNEIARGSKSALNKMIQANLRLVIKIAKSYVSPEWQLEDLVQEGNLGLFKAAEKFDPEVGVRFASYATWWVRQSILRSINNKKRSIRLPSRKEETLRHYYRSVQELTQTLQRCPTREEVGKHMQCSIEEVKKAESLCFTTVSFEHTNNEDNASISSCIGDIRNAPETLYFKNEIITETKKVLEKLKSREKEVIKRRFEIDNHGKSTLKSIANNMSVSQETIRQVEKKALHRIKTEFAHLQELLER